MDDFKVIARLLSAIHAGEENPPFNLALIDEKVLQTTAAKRDRLAIKLQKEGYVEGLFVIDDIDNQPVPVVMWNASKPEITLKGLEYIASNSSLQKALKEIAKATISSALAMVSNAAMALLH